MDLQQIKEALNENNELLDGLTSHLLDTDKMKEVITNKAENIFKERITGEVNKMHSLYDNDMFEVLGEKPEVLEDGRKQKTYEKAKSLFSELAELRKQKDSLSKDEKVRSLQSQIEELKTNGVGSHWEQTFKAEQEKWKEEKTNLLSRAEQAENSIINFQKQADINSALSGLKFNDDIPEAARKALIDNVVNKLISNSKIENGKVIYLNEDGSQINNNEYKAESVSNILKGSLKDVLKIENTDGGGGASKSVSGSIETISVEGKDVKKLNLQEGSFKSKAEFVKHSEEALLKSGVTRGSQMWDSLKNEAYTRYNVSNLPRV